MCCNQKSFYTYEIIIDVKTLKRKLVTKSSKKQIYSSSSAIKPGAAGIESSILTSSKA